MKIKYSIFTITMFCVVSNESVSITRSKPLNLKTIGTNSEEVIEENAFKDLHDFNFPDVTYPTSILESCQPFYFNSNPNGLDAIVGPFSSEVKSNYMSLLSNNENKKAPTKIPELKDKFDFVSQFLTEDLIDHKEELDADTIEVIPEVNVISSELEQILSILYKDDNENANNTSLDVVNYADIYSLLENLLELDISDDSVKNTDTNEPDEIEENATEDIYEGALASIEEYTDYIMKSDNTYIVKETPEHINETDEKFTESSLESFDYYLLNATNIDVNLSELVNEYIDLYENIKDSKLGEEILESVIYEIDHYLKLDDSDTIEPVYEIINDDIYYNLSDSNLGVIERESINENIENDFNSNGPNIEIEEHESKNESIDDYSTLDNHNSVGDPSVNVVVQGSINEDVDNVILSSLDIENEEIENKSESIFVSDNLNSENDSNVDIVVQESIKEDVGYDFNLSSSNIEIDELETINESVDSENGVNTSYVDIIAQEYIQKDVDNDFYLNFSNIEIKNLEPKTENIDDYNSFENNDSVNKSINLDLNQSDLNTDEKMLEVINVDDGIITIPKEAVVFDVIYKDGCYLEKPVLDIVPSNIPVRLKINIEICKDEFRVGDDSYMKEINKELQTLNSIENQQNSSNCKENVESCEEESVTEEQITVLDEINESDFISALSILLLDSLNNKPLEISAPEIINTECDLNISISNVLEHPNNENIYSEHLEDKLESSENEQVGMHKLLFSNENSNERFTSPLITILSPKTTITIDQEIPNNISGNLEQLVMSNNKSESTEYEDDSTKELIEMCPLLSILYNKTEKSSELMEKVLCISQEDIAEIIDVESSIEASEDKRSAKRVDSVEAWPLIDVFQLRITEANQTLNEVSGEQEDNKH